MNYIQYNYYIIECLTRRKKQNIPHCHFTKIDLNEKITLFAKLLLGKFFNQVGQDLSFSKSPTRFQKILFLLKIENSFKKFEKQFLVNTKLLRKY